jgi:hypothetical protein
MYDANGNLIKNKFTTFNRAEFEPEAIRKMREEWSKKEGWSELYFDKNVLDKILNPNDEAI